MEESSWSRPGRACKKGWHEPETNLAHRAGSAGCNRSTAQKLTEALGVKLQDLQTKYEPAAEVAAEPGSGRGRPARPRIVYRQIHQAYAKILLGRAVGSACAAMGERDLERHCGGLSWQGGTEVVSARGREMELLKEVLRDDDLPGEVRLFLEEALSGYPDLDIRLLAAARGRESSDEGREELTRTMRELL